MVAASVIPTGAVNVLRLSAVKDAGLVRVATRVPGSLSVLFSLILTLVLRPETVPKWISTSENV